MGWLTEPQDSWRSSVYAALLNAGKALTAERFNRCGTSCKLSCGHCGTGRTIAQWCETRVCPDCSARRAKRIRYRVINLMKGHPATGGHRAKEITLTVQTNGRFQEAVERITKALPRLWKSYLWRDAAGRRWHEAKREPGKKECVTGAVCGLEFGPRNGNVHVHMLYLGPYLVFAELRAIWRKLVGEGSVFVCAAGGARAAVAEVIKYMSDIKKLPGSRVVELYEYLEGKRRIRSYGILRGVEGEAGDDQELPVCTNCGGTTWLTEAGLEWVLRHGRPGPEPGG